MESNQRVGEGELFSGERKIEGGWTPNKGTKYQTNNNKKPYCIKKGKMSIIKLAYRI